MTGEIPDIKIGYVVTSTMTFELDAKCAGKAGTAGTADAVMNASNEALAPFTPEKILRSPGKI